MEVINEEEVLIPYDCRNNKPKIEFIKNNVKNDDILCLNYVYQRHAKGKYVWNYTCRVKGCNASISLRLDGGAPALNCPSYLQLKHTNHKV
jgi:hypothetical protein